MAADESATISRNRCNVSKVAEIIDSASEASLTARNINQACCDTLEAALSGILDRLATTIPESFWRAAGGAENEAVRGACRNALAVFGPDAPVFERFRAKVLLQAESLGAPISSGIDDRRDEIVSDDSLEDWLNEILEDWLNLVGETHRLEVAFSGQLRVLERRLARIGNGPLDTHNNPYGPTVLGRTFRKALAGLPLKNEARIVAYKALGQVLEKFLGPLYIRLIELTAPLVLESDPDFIADVGSSGDLATFPVAIQELPDRPESPSETEALDAEPPSTADPEERSAPPLSAIFAMLMRQSRRARISEIDWERLAAASEVFQGRLPEPQVNALQLLGAVLHRVHSDASTPRGLRPLIKQWQSPLLKLACRDPHILNEPDHPVRKLLDTLDQVSLATDSEGLIQNPFQQQLREWIEGLGSGDGLESEQLAHAVAELEQLTAPLLQRREDRLQHLRETCEAQQRLKAACRAVDDEVEARFSEPTVPRLIVDFLKLGWRHWLIRVHLQSGDQSEAWHEGWAVLESLWGWLASEASPPNTISARRLIEFIEERLKTVCTDLKGYKNFIETLNASLLDGRPVDRVTHARRPTPSAAEAAERRTRLERLQPFRIGDWLLVAITPGAPPVPLYLAWIADDHDRFVFVDRQGNQRLDLEAEDFALYLDTGRLTRGEDLDLPLSERTISALMQALLESLRQQSMHDPVTEFLNRKGFMQLLESEFAAGANRANGHVLLNLEIEPLRDIIGSCGSGGAERLLQTMAGALQQVIGDRGCCVRLGESQFGVLLQDCDLEHGRATAGMLLERFHGYRFEWEHSSYPVGIYVGLAAFRTDTDTPALVLKRAEMACLAAREQSTTRLQVCTADHPVAAAREPIVDWSVRIDSVLAHRRLFSRCQRIAPLAAAARQSPHYEILLGIQDDDGRTISPGDFVAATERWSRVTEIDRFQIESVFEWIRQHPVEFAEVGGFSINLSGQSLISPAFLSFLQDQLKRADWPLEKITFEITETAAISEFNRAEHFIRKIRRHGCRFSLDDFGTGVASFGCLKNLPVDHLKIDGMFIRDLAESEADFTMVRSINDLGHSLGMKTIAESVESEAVADRLREIGVDYVQGYLVGKPHPLEDL